MNQAANAILPTPTQEIIPMARSGKIARLPATFAWQDFLKAAHDTIDHAANPLTP